MLVELELLAAMVVALAGAIWIFRFSATGTSRPSGRKRPTVLERG